ncbi:MAG: DsrE/DsrF/DrsH-like family protein [Candidatus Freyrarchaeum guaymaensis]
MERLAFIVGSDSFEKLMMSIILARTGIAMDVETHLFFTFWGLNLLRKGGADKAKLSMPPPTNKPSHLDDQAQNDENGVQETLRNAKRAG